jgi:hypothetical protein
MLFTEYPKQGIALLVGFGKVMKYPSKFQKICYGVQCIYGIAWRGIVGVLTSFNYEQTLLIAKTHAYTHGVEL